MQKEVENPNIVIQIEVIITWIVHKISKWSFFERMEKMGLGPKCQLRPQHDDHFVINENAKSLTYYTQSHKHLRSHKLIITQFSMIMEINTLMHDDEQFV